MHIDELTKKLAAIPVGHERTSAMARALGQYFRVQPDDIGIFSFDAEMQVLRFLWPLKLQASGFLPLSSPDSLAAKTLRESKAYLNNRFATTIHPSIFEKIKLDKEAKDAPTPIQKIISVPLQTEGLKKGVIQICRKGLSSGEAGPDFSKEDLAALVEIAKAFTPLI